MIVKPEFKDKSIRSFVIRGGRMTEGQLSAFDEWWPKYGRSLHDGLAATADIFALGKPVVVEVGFGMGDSLLEMAMADPETLFVGIEVHPPGVGRLINEAGRNNLDNLWVFMADATDVLTDCFSDNSLERLQLFFPDPWHKKKHNKRRIVQLPFISTIAKKLRVGGVLHMATDWQPYSEYMVEVLAGSNDYVNKAGDVLFSPAPDYRPKTKFEKRGERLGHGVWDLLYEKKADGNTTGV
ncbi:MAG: tRNA (guanosine(46)-N7)-methyltransferase TrmB [Marinagarivorans sp.]|nr:tRNA (guanosine(46)-N7)-methyltransferase TrmB [Marinagarivorans sp.]